LAGGTFCGYNRQSATGEIVILSLKHVLLCMTLASAAGCRTADPAPPEYRPRAVVELARWEVRAAGQGLGELVQFEIQDPRGAVRFYRVLDGSGRWLGHADANGRFSRRVPFEEQEQDLGMQSLARGCELLFESRGPVTLTAKAVEVVEASFDGGR
jgi:hypothetical protein